jgi:CBS-domain-containing membrane protein
VVDQHGKPLGIISTMDIIAALLNALHEQEIAV